MRPWKLITTLAGIAAASALVGSANAQNALGDGRVLDANQSIGSYGRNPEVPQLDFRIGNLLVTGNVAAGRGFRQTVGYTAADDFRAASGSDTLFNFERNSALSAISYINLGRSYSPLSLGQDLGVVEIQRPSIGTSINSIRRYNLKAAFEWGEYVRARARLDSRILAQQSALDLFNLETNPNTLRIQRDAEGNPMRVTVSPTRGLREVPLQADVTSLGLTVFDQASIIEDALENKGNPFITGQTYEDDFNKYRIINGQIEANTTDSALSPVTPVEYNEILKEVTSRYAQTTPELGTTIVIGESVSEELDLMRKWLAGDDEQAQPVTPDLQLTGDGKNNVDENKIPEIPELPDIPDPIIKGDQRTKTYELPSNLNIDMLKHGRTINKLSPENAEGRFAEILTNAEAKLSEGNYFLAEREFLRSLKFRPDHPMAMAGLANAQLGAGVQASAGVSIRNLFNRHPQMIDASYVKELLPSNDRIKRVIKSIRKRVTDGRVGSETALLLAYIGRQLQDEDIMIEGIDLMESIDNKDPLIPVLRQIWLDQSSDKDTDAESDDDDGEAEEPEK